MRGRKRFFSALAGVLCAAILLTGCGGEPAQPVDPGEGSQTEKTSLFGIAEPFAGSHVKGFHLETATGLIRALGAKTARMWMEPTDLFEGWNFDAILTEEQLSEVSEAGKMTYNSYLDAYEAAGVEEVTAQGVFFPKTESTANGRDATTVPARDLTEGSEYMQFLKKVEILWKALAEAFPRVDVWELGNEINHNPFAHAAGYRENGAQDQDPSGSGNPTTFSMEEKAAFAADYMYYASRGVHAGNPEAIAVTPGLAAVGGIGANHVPAFLEAVYRNIESGEFPAGATKSTQSSDYFQGVAWHPYPGNDGLNVEGWKAANDALYAVLEAHGDGDLELWLTEFGFTASNPTDPLEEDWEEEQASWYKSYFEAAEEMEYLHTIHVFRLFCCEADTGWGGPGEEFFGLFLEPDGERGFVPRRRAYAIQEIFGGSGDLMQFAERS